MLEHLWKSARFQDHVYTQAELPSWNLNASMLGMKDGYIEYAQNKPIFCNIHEDDIDPSQYNAHNGDGTFERVVTALRANVVG